LRRRLPEEDHIGQVYAGVVRPAGAAVDDPLQFKSGARRLEQGMPGLAGVAASRAGLDLLLEVGMPTVEQHVLELSGQCIEGLSRRDLQLYTRAETRLRAGVVALPIVQGKRLMDFLRDRAVDVWTDPSETLLRIDPHVFNNSSDLDKFFNGLDEYRQRFGPDSLQAA